MSGPKTIRRATEAEMVAHYLEAALVAATDKAASLRARQIDAPSLVALTFVDAFPPGTTTEQIHTALMAPYQAPDASPEAVIHG